MSIHEDHHKVLIQGLTWEYQDLYLNNTHFYHSINNLVPPIQILVDGLASRAKELGEIDERQHKRLMEG